MNKDNVTKIFKKIPTLETPSLILRKMKLCDFRDMYDYARRESVTKYLLWNSHPNPDYTFDYISFIQLQYRTGKFYDWALINKENNKMIGTCGFASLDFSNNSGEIGYVINPDYKNKGYATEAVKRVIAFGFSVLNLHRIEARYMVGNDASKRVMEKCGMTFEGILRSSVFVRNNYVDVGYYSITADEYMNFLFKAKENREKLIKGDT